MSTRILDMRIPKNTVGLVMAFDFILEFLTWADGRELKIPDIMEHFGLSRSSAYRYRSAYRQWKEKRDAREWLRKHGMHVCFEH